MSFAFDPAVLRSTKGGNGPRRLVRAPPFPEALEKLNTLVHDMEEALDLFEEQYTLQQARVRLERLSRKRPSVLVNAFLHIHLLVGPSVTSLLWAHPSAATPNLHTSARCSIT